MIAADGIGVYAQAHDANPEIALENYADLVKRIAQHMIVRMPASVQIDDLTQAGMIGLIEAAKKYDPSRGASFETYAGIRIRGAIVDEVRKGDWVPRSVHRNARRISEAIAQAEAQLGRDPTSSEVAQIMGVDIDQYHSMSNDATSGRLFSIEDSYNEDDYDLDTAGKGQLTPADSVQRQAMQHSLSQAITTLPEREKLVLSLYYDEELNLKEIGQVLGVSESRVSQIHSQAALRLRAKLKDWHNHS